MKKEYYGMLTPLLYFSSFYHAPRFTEVDINSPCLILKSITERHSSFKSQTVKGDFLSLSLV